MSSSLRLYAVISLIIFFVQITSFSQVFSNPKIVDMPLPWSVHREQLIKEYSEKHYGISGTQIIPRAVVIHWTASGTWESAYRHFYGETLQDGTLNVASHFLVDRDGTIYRLTPEICLNRHVIGYNWCSIGVENVGGVNGAEDLTDAQLAANIYLIRYLKSKYPTLDYVFGHYQQDVARSTGLYIEKVPGYMSKKIDPGAKFMYKLKEHLQYELSFIE